MRALLVSLLLIGCGSATSTGGAGGGQAGAGGGTTGSGGGSVGGGSGGGSVGGGGGSGGGGGGSGAGGGAAMAADGGAPCPTSGAGAITSPSCTVFTPEQAGLPASGEGATKPNYALEPVGVSKNALVVHLNGSLGSPAGQIGDPMKNFFNAAAQQGFHVLALSYRSNQVIGITCNNNPSCFGLARKTIILGQAQTGGPAGLANIQAHEGIVARLDAAIRFMAAAHPNAGWDQFLSSGTIGWSKVIATGHSQGGGHAAYLAQLFPLRRVIQLSSTCDEVNGTPAPWTAASQTWATSPATAFVGFSAPTTFTNGAATAGDTLCPYHLAIWQGMGLDPSRIHDDAEVCGMTGQTHSVTIQCGDNFARWGTLFQ